MGKVVGGLIGGIGGGIGSAAGTKALADQFTDDDAKEMFNLLQDAIAQLAEDFMLTEDEFIKSNIENKIKETVNQKWLERMYQAGSAKNGNPGRINFAYKEFEKRFENIISQLLLFTYIL